MSLKKPDINKHFSVIGGYHMHRTRNGPSATAKLEYDCHSCYYHIPARISLQEKNSSSTNLLLASSALPQMLIYVIVYNNYIERGYGMGKIPVEIDIKKVANNADLFVFSISTPLMRSQFRIPRAVLNQLRILIERTLTHKQGSK